MKFVSFQCSVFSALLVTFLSAAEPLPLSPEYWKDEGFLKSFNGSYRINAQIEPTVTSEERGLLVSIQSLMAKGEREDALKKIDELPLLNLVKPFFSGLMNAKCRTCVEYPERWKDAGIRQSSCPWS